MGYDLHITRKDDWSDTDGREITLEEWILYTSGDTSLKIDRDHSAEQDPAVASGAKEPGHAIWVKWPARKEGQREAWVWHAQGNLIAADPDASFRRKLFLIADSLDAKLQGDGGEIYNSNGEPEKGRIKLTADGRKRAWWKFW